MRVYDCGGVCTSSRCTTSIKFHLKMNEIRNKRNMSKNIYSYNNPILRFGSVVIQCMAKGLFGLERIDDSGGSFLGI